MAPHILCSRRLPRRGTSRKGGVGGASRTGREWELWEQWEWWERWEGWEWWTLTKCGDAIIDDCEL